MNLYTPSDESRILSEDGKYPEFNCTPYQRDYTRIVHSPSFRRLQYKTQVFPLFESDFFRTRLTHSLEVAYIAKAIARKINNENEFFKKEGNHIDLDIVEIAAFAHDLGHAPFGHNGELALDSRMKDLGGYEGNAQSLRILTKLEKKQKLSFGDPGIDTEEDKRFGLNLTARSLAAILKYDNKIHRERADAAELEKGYYYTEEHIVNFIKEKVTGIKNFDKPFKTIECHIMDLADDIAYSVYDLEDALKAKFLTILDCNTVPRDTLSIISRKLSKYMEEIYDEDAVEKILYNIFENFIAKSLFEEFIKTKVEKPESIFYLIATAYKENLKYSDDGYMRTILTSQLIGDFINGFECFPDKEIPALSQVKFNKETKEKVGVLKYLTYCTIISSHLLKVPEYRSRDIITAIFDALMSSGHNLLPDDYHADYINIKPCERKRVICDFIAGMTDRYILEFYGRLKSENPQTIFKPI